jgi:hypothetical protein
MAVSQFRASRSQWKHLIYPSAVSLLIFGGIVYLFSTHKSDDELQRESVCKNWGFDDDQSLAKCRQSQAGVDAVIAPKFQRAKLREITNFNQELANSAQHRAATNESDYKSASIGEIAKAVGGAIGFSGKNDTALEGQKFKLVGRILTETPDQSDPDQDRTWEPQSFEIWGPMPKAKSAMPDIVRLDIESLNRDERKLIQDHCEMVSFARCDAVIFGHVGTVSEDKDIHLRYRGIIADEVLINPINVKEETK